MSRENVFGKPNVSPSYEDNYNGAKHKLGQNASNKEKYNRPRSKSRNRKVPQENFVQTTTNHQNRRSTNFQSLNHGNHEQITTPHYVTSPAPKSICRNRSITVHRYPFVINENAGFYTDIQKLKNENNPKKSFVEDSAILNNSTVHNLTENSEVNNSFQGQKLIGACPKSLSASKSVKLGQMNNLHSKPSAIKDSLPEISKENDVNVRSGVKSPSLMNKERVSYKESIYSENTQNSTKINVDRNLNKSSILVNKSSAAIEPICSDSDKQKTVSLKNKLYARLQKGAELSKEKTETKCNKNETLKQRTVKSQETCTCDKCNGFMECSAWCKNNLFFASEPKDSRKGLPLLKNNFMERVPTITKTVDNKIILQGPIIPKPVFSLDQTFIDETIQNNLQTLNCTSAKDIQSYIWPAVQRGLSVFMVGPPKCGKTFAYLPAFCSLCIEKNERYAEFSEYEGPLVLILCATLEDCCELQNCTKNCITSGDVTIEVLTDEASVQGNCDILIAVPSVLENHLKSSTVKMKRLCHMAIEKGHVVLKNQCQSIQKILKAVNIIQTNRPRNKNIQVVVSSEKWSLDLETLLKKLYTTPLVCFEDFLEAAVYSKVQFKKKKTKTTYKLFQLVDILKGHYMTQKAVVFCSEEEIFKLKEQLIISGIECIAISNNLIEDEIFENEDTWNFLRCGHLKVLLCTDSVFEKAVNVSSAQWLIHYHLPTDWQQYQKRFRCLSANINSPFDAQETIVYELQSKCSFIIIDELCNDQLFLDFFEILTRNCTKYLQL
ncbi:hypothetical protein Zmor_023545 [Zophobas morio]|uniref:RNA helicase n=1 Tax=Zophobas morio TaxID=2755281 RepID=A0AA38I031_9CUCU|nr:hypothetical protein Zmor_023545 [Zophobas morio]